MGTDALLIVTESGKEEERDLDFLPEDTIIALVLLSVSLISLTFSVFLVSVNVIFKLDASLSFSRLISDKRMFQQLFCVGPCCVVLYQTGLHEVVQLA